MSKTRTTVDRLYRASLFFHRNVTKSVRRQTDPTDTPISERTGLSDLEVIDHKKKARMCCLAKSVRIPSVGFVPVKYGCGKQCEPSMLILECIQVASRRGGRPHRFASRETEVERVWKGQFMSSRQQSGRLRSRMSRASRYSLL